MPVGKERIKGWDSRTSCHPGGERQASILGFSGGVDPKYIYYIYISKIYKSFDLKLFTSTPTSVSYPSDC